MVKQTARSSWSSSHSFDSGIFAKTSNKLIASLCTVLVSLLTVPPVSWAEQPPAQLDLSSTERTIEAGSHPDFQPTTIQVGDATRSVGAGDLLTPSEHIAVTQILNTGAQSLMLGTFGNAVGGSFHLDPAMAPNIGNLIVPNNVSVIHDFANTSEVNIAGNLTNAGTVFAVSTNAAVTNAVFNASQILNQPGGLITSVLPVGGLPSITNTISSLDLTLNAVHDLINQGTISSSGNLNLAAGDSLINYGTLSAIQNVNLASTIGSIVNSGTITSLAGNININSQLASVVAQQVSQSLNISNYGGVMQALAGAINVRDSLFDGDGDILIGGGNLVARELNLYAGTGDIAAELEQVSGSISAFGNYARVGASTAELTLGNIKIDGDPTFYNDAGNITITGDVLVNERLAIVASGNITTTAAVNEIRARDGGGQGFDIHIVAGANITGSGGSTPTVPGTQASGNVTVNGPSATGGSVDFSLSPLVTINSNSTCSNCSGGNVVLAAFRGSTAGSGTISLPTSSEINVSGSGAGSNGTVTIIAGADSGAGVTTGNITADGGAPGTGNISIATAQPAFSTGSSLTFDASGEITTGNNLIPASTIENAGVTLGGSLAAGSFVNVSAGQDIMTPHTVVDTVEVGTNPQGVAVNPAGTVAYVTNHVNNTVSVIDTSTNEVIDTIPVGNNPLGVAFTPSGDFAYVANRDDDTVSVIDTATSTVIATITVQNVPEGIAVDPAGTFIYVTNVQSDSVSVINGSTNMVVATITVGAGPRGVAVDPNGAFMYVANFHSDSVSVIDRAAGRVVSTVPVGDSPFGIAVDPGRGLLYVANFAGNSISVVDTETRTVVDTVTVGTGPEGIAVNPAGTFAYTVNTGTDDVSIIDLSSREVLGSVPAGTFPRALGKFVNFVGDNVTAYVPDVVSAKVSVVKLPSIISPALTLQSTTGDINVGTNAGANTLTVNTSGDVIITEADDIGIGASTVGGRFFVGAGGNISTSAPIVADVIDFESTLPDGFISIGANLTGINSITLTTAAATDSRVLQTAGTISLPNGNLVLNTPNFGNNSSIINVTGGDDLVFDAPVTGDTVNISTTSNNGSITLKGDVTGLTSVTLTAHGAGSLVTAHNVVATIAVGAAPQDSVVNSAGTFAYISNGSSDTVSVIDTATNEVVNTIPVTGGPVAMTILPDDSFVYVVKQTANSVAVIDTSTNSVVTTINVGNLPRQIAAHPDGTFVYVANQNSNTVSVINTTTNTVVATVPVANAPTGVSVHPEGTFVYVARTFGGAVSVIDTSTNTVVANITTGPDPFTTVVNPIGNFAYVRNGSAATIVVIETRTNQIVTSIPLPSSPQGMAVNTAGTYLYATRPSADSLAIVNTATNQVVTTVPVGDLPLFIDHQIQFVGNNVTLYVPNLSSDNVSVVRLPAIVSPTVSLTSTSGNIDVATGSTTANLTANTSGNVTITSPGAVGLGASTVGGTFFVGSSGAISTSGSITANRVNFQSTSPTGIITIGANLTGTNGVTIATLLGTNSRVLQTGGLISIPNGTFQLQTPQFGDGGSFINVSAGNSLVFDPPITGQTVNITTTANDGSITLRRNVTGGTSVTLLAHGAGQVTTPHGVISTIPVGDFPFAVAINSAGTFAYIANASADSVSVVDTETNTVVATVPVGDFPRGVAVNPDGSFAYVVNRLDNSVSVIDTVTNTVVDTIPVGTEPFGIAVEPTGAFAYVANGAGNSVSVIDLSSNDVTATIPVSGSPHSIAVNPSGKFVYVTRESSANIAVIDTSTNTVVKTVSVGTTPAGVAVNPAGTFVYVVNNDSNNVSIIETASHTVTGTISVGNNPVGISINPAGTFAYVGNGNNDNISIISLATNTVLSTVSVGDAPIAAGSFVGFVGSNATAYVANASADTVSVVQLPAIIAPDISLSSTSGNINVGTDAGPTTVVVNTSGDVTLTDSSDIGIGASTVGGTFFVGAAGNFATTAAITANRVIFQSFLPAGNITVGADLTGTLGIALSTAPDGDSRVLQTGGQISLPNGGFVLNTPQFGDPASMINVTSTQQLTFDVPIVGDTVQVTTTANDVSIIFNGNVTALTSAVVTAHGDGSVLTPHSVIATIPTPGGHLFGTVLSKDGTRAYVSSFANSLVFVIDTATNEVIETITGVAGASGVAISESLNRLVVTGFGTSDTTIIDTNTNAIVATVNTGASQLGVAVNPAGDRAYVANLGNDTLAVIDLNTNTLVTTIPTGSSPDGVDITSDGSRVYVANESGSVSVIDTATNTEIERITVPGGVVPAGIGIDPTGTFAYVTLAFGSNSVSVIDIQTNTIVGSFGVGSDPVGIDVNPAGTLVYVPNRSSDNVSIVNAATNSVIQTVPVGSRPLNEGQFSGYVGDNLRAYIANRDGQSVSVLEMPTIKAPSVALSSGSGDIIVSTRTDSLTANTGGGGIVLVTEYDDLQLGASSAGGSFFAGAVGSLTTTDMVSAGTVQLSSALTDGTMTIGANLTGTNGVVLSTVLGTESGILQTSGQISAPFGSVTINTPHLGDSNSFINITSGEALSFAMPIDANTIVLSTTANNSSIKFNRNVTAVTSIDVTAHGSGDIVTPHNVIATIDVGAAPRGVAVAGTRAYIANQSADTVSVISTETNTVIATITVGDGPRGVAITPDGSRAYVTNAGSDDVSVIDTTTNTVIHTIPVGSSPFGISVNGEGTEVYVVSQGTGRVFVIDVVANAVVDDFAVGPSPLGIAFSPWGGFAYIGNTGNNTVSVIDTTDNSIVTNIAVGVTPYGIAVNPTGKTVYVVNNDSNNVFVIDASTNTVIDIIAVGLGPLGVSINPAGTFAYVANGFFDTVSIINTATNTVVDNVPVGDSPLSIGSFVAFVGDNVRAYVPNQDGANVSVIELPLLTAPVVHSTSSGGTINLGTNAGTLTANTIGGGSVTITEREGVSLGASGAGDAFFAGALGSIITTGAISAVDLVLQATGHTTSVDINAPLTASGNLSVTAFDVLNVSANVQGASTNFVTNVFNLSAGITATDLAGTFTLSSPEHHTLTINTGANTITAPGGLSFSSGLPLIQFRTSGLLTLDGQVQIDSCPGFVSIAAGSSISTNNNDVTIEACSVFNSNLIDTGSGTLTINVCPGCPPVGTGGGTIVSSVGPVVLSKNTVINSRGLDVAIISVGDISSDGSVTIDLSGSNGNGGILNIFAGVEITPGTFGQVLDRDTSFTVSGPSAQGGSVNLAGAIIKTGTRSAAASGGNVTIIANAGTQSSGSITVRSIDSSSDSGAAGSITMIAPGGITINKDIRSSGAGAGGSVGLFASNPVQPDTLIVFNGLVFGGDPHQPGCAACSGTNHVSVEGGIYTDSASGQGGDVIVEASGPISVGRSITTAGFDAGNVILANNLSTVSIGQSVIASGGSIKNASSSLDAGNGGNLVVDAHTFLVGKDILVNGGSTTGTGAGGAGGLIDVDMPRLNPNSYATGAIVVGGYIDARGGNGTSGGGGGGGCVCISAGTVAVSGQSNGNSINASGGTGASIGLHGDISIETFGVQSLPVNFDLTSNKASEYALPGALFTTGASSNAVNGTRGNIVSGPDVATSANAGRIVDGSPFSMGNVNITVTGGSIVIDQSGNPFTVAPDNGAGTRNKITPGQAIAAFQVSRDSAANVQTIGINTAGQVIDASPNGGGNSRLIVDFFDLSMPTPFSRFNLATADPSGLNLMSLNVQGQVVILDLQNASNIRIGGTIDFMNSGADVRLDVGKQTITVLNTGAVVVSQSGSLELKGDYSKVVNQGVIRAHLIEMQTLSNQLSISMGPGSLLGNDLTSSGTGTVWIGAAGLQLTGGTLVDTTLTLPNSPKLANVEISTGFDNSAALGNIRGRSITIANPVGTVSDINIAENANVFADSNLSINSTGTVTIAGGVHLAAGKDGTIAAASDLLVGEGTFLQMGSALSLSTATGTVVVGEGASIWSPGGNVTITGTGVVIGQNSSIKAGRLSPLAPSTGVLSKSDIASAGQLSINAGTDGMVVAVAGANLSSAGGDLSIVVNGGSAGLGQSSNFAANGGNLRIFASGQITGGSSNTFTARAIQKNGGGIEIGSGLTSSQNIKSAFGQPAGTAPAPSTLGSDVVIDNGGGTRGVVQRNATGGGTVDLSTSGSNTATLNLNRGVMVFDAVGAGATVELDGATFITDALVPIAYNPAGAVFFLDSDEGACDEGGQCPPLQSVEDRAVANVYVEGRSRPAVLQARGTSAKQALVRAGTARPLPQGTVRAGCARPVESTASSVTMTSGAAFIHALEDMTVRTALGDVCLDKNALVSLQVEDGVVRVAACSGPGHVIVAAGGHKIVLDAGREIAISTRPLSQIELQPADSVGRRTIQSHTLAAGLHLTTCDVSLVSLIANSSHLRGIRSAQTAAAKNLQQRLVKTAAVLHHVRGSRGAFTGRAKVPAPRSNPVPERYARQGDKLLKAAL